MGYDRPSPDHANAKVILLISSAPRDRATTSTRTRSGSSRARPPARSSSSGTRASPTRRRWPIPGSRPWPGSEAAILLAIARHLVATKRYDREFVRRWVNWEEYLRSTLSRAERAGVGAPGALTNPSKPPLLDIYKDFTFEYAARESGVEARVLEGSPRTWPAAEDASPPTTGEAPRPATSAAGRSPRCLWFLNVLTGLRRPRRRHAPRTDGTSGCRARRILAPHVTRWNELSWPREYPLSLFRDELPPPALPEGRARASSTSTSPASTTRCGRTPTASSWLESARATSRRSGCTSR